MKYFAPSAVLLACLILGCDRNTEVRQYRQPKDAPAAPAADAVQMPSGHPATQPSSEPAHEAGLGWKLPEGWREDANPRPMRYATIAIGEGDSSAELIITRLTGSFGDPASNLNRWRQQVGLEPLAEAPTTPENPLKTPVGNVNLLEFVGPEKQMTVAILKQDNATWFFKLVGPKAAVAGQREKFEQFLSSLTTR